MGIRGKIDFRFLLASNHDKMKKNVYHHLRSQTTKEQITERSSSEIMKSFAYPFKFSSFSQPMCIK